MLTESPLFSCLTAFPPPALYSPGFITTRKEGQFQPMEKQDFNCSAKALEVLINQYFQDCDDSKVFYSEPGLCNYINMPLPRYRYYMKVSEKYLSVVQGRQNVKDEIGDKTIQYGHLEVLARASLRIGEQLSNRTDKMALAQIKQLHLGGYDDKAGAKSSSEPVKIEVSLKGAGGNPFG